MTGDILERIKAWVYTPALYQTQLDAAEEIESLRTEVLKLRALLRYEKARVDLIEAEAYEWRKTAEGVRAELYAASIKSRVTRDPARPPSMPPQPGQAPKVCASCGRT